jgi:transposase
MAKRLTITPHLSIANLEALYRDASDPTRRTHYQIIWLLAKGRPTRDVADVTGYSRDWIGKLARRYNQEGPDALGDHRSTNPGNAPILNDAQQQELRQALLEPHPHEGLWNSRLVAEWIFEKTGRQVRAQRGWEYLKRLGFSRQKPRPQHQNADEDEQEAFKKNSSWRPS